MKKKTMLYPVNALAIFFGAELPLPPDSEVALMAW
jgi:hypothetical protein